MPEELGLDPAAAEVELDPAAPEVVEATAYGAVVEDGTEMAAEEVDAVVVLPIPGPRTDDAAVIEEREVELLEELELVDDAGSWYTLTELTLQ